LRLKSGASFCVKITQKPALFRIKSATTMNRRLDV
jgi:hypothetical protein